MASIINFPKGLCFSENLPKLVLSNVSEPQLIVLKKGYEVILEEKYEPSENKIEVDFSNVIREELSLTTPSLSSNKTNQSLAGASFSISAIGETKEFVVIKGGVQDLSVEVSEYCKQNFLTHQPQLKGVRPYQPEFLTYCAVQSCKVKLRGYFADKPSETIIYSTLSSATLTTLNVSYYQVSSLFSQPPSVIDVFVTDNDDERISIVQRYALIRDFYEVYSIYLFENTVGGFDTLIAKGERKRKNVSKFEIASIDAIINQYDVNVKFLIEQNIGVQHRLENVLFDDFTMSSNRWEFIDNGLIPIYLSKVNENDSSEDDLSNRKFSYFYAKNKNIQKSQKVLNDLPLPKGLVPADDLFFLINEAAQHVHYNLALLEALSFNDGYLLVNGNKIKASVADATRNALLWAGHKFGDYLDQPVRSSDKVIHKSLSSKKFVPGFSGEGYKIDENNNATFDNLVVRKQMQVYELLINKIRATNGAIWVSDAMKYEKDYGTDSEYYCIGVDEKDNSRLVVFQKDDIILSQRWTGNGIKRSVLTVSSVASEGKFVKCKKSSLIGAVPEIGDEFVRIGNTTNQNRQGAIYLTASDDNAPYLDVLDGVDSDSFINKIKVRLGRLKGINDPDLGELDGYGLYGQNVFLKGVFHVTGGNAETKSGSEKLVQDLINSLGSAAYVDKVEKAMLGDSLIVGGYLRNELIDVVNREKNFVLSDVIFRMKDEGTRLSYTEGSIIHKGLGDSNMLWNIEAGNIPNLDAGVYNLYVKAPKSLGVARILATKTVLELDSGSYYYIPLGELSSVNNGIRSINVSSGYTRIAPGEITTGRWKSPNSGDYIEYGDEGISICGNVLFRSGSSTTNLAEWAGITDQNVQNADNKINQVIEDAQQKVAAINAKFSEIQSQIDGEVSNWYYGYKPTLSNYPASSWTTNTEKDKHIGDTFTNTQNAPAEEAGKSWRFVKEEKAYKWRQISDSDAVKALQKASKAQSTADGKSTTYLTQPTAYKMGDMWLLNTLRTVNGVSYKRGEVLTASQDSDVFVENHWGKLIRYTDDTAIKNLEIGTQNLIDNSVFASDNYFTVRGTATYSETPLKVSLKKDTGENDCLIGCTRIIPVEYVGKELTFSIDVLPSVNVAGWLYIKEFNSGNYTWTERKVVEGGKMTRLSLVFTPQEQKIVFYYKHESKSPQYLYGGFMLTEGAKPIAWQPSLADRESAIQKIKDDAEKERKNLSKEIKENKKALKDFKEVTFESFKDGIVDKAEKEGIKSHRQILLNEYKDLERQKSVIVNNANLPATPKSNLIEKWGAYHNSYSELDNAISNAIADSKIEPSEHRAVERGFSNYRKKLVALRSALEEAIQSIEKTKINAVKFGSENIINNTAFSDSDKYGYYRVNGNYSAEKNARTISINNDENNGFLYKKFEIDPRYIGQELTFSVEVSTVTEVDFKLVLHNLEGNSVQGSNTSNYFNVTQSDGVKVVGFQVTPTHSTIRLSLYNYSKGHELIVYSGFMLAEGNKALRWQPSLADREAATNRKIDNIGKIGENLLKNPNLENYDHWEFSSSKNKHSNDEYTGNFDTAINIYSNCKMSQSIPLKKGVYEFSCYVRCYADNSTGRIRLSIGDESKEFSINSSYKKISFKTKLSASKNSVSIQAVNDSDIMVAKTYLGRYNDWVGKVEPVIKIAEYLSKALKQSTEVIGGLVLASILAVKDGGGKVRSYINGDPNANPIAFASGVDKFGTNKETQKLKITHEGKIRAEDAYIKGEIEAERGKIGGIEINEDGLGASGLTQKLYGEGTQMFINQDELIFTRTVKSLISSDNGVSLFRYTTKKTVVNADGVTTTTHHETSRF